jgi:alginate O-acetyltransferase complex protein AlgI
MNFNSITFLFIFIPIVWVVFISVPRYLRIPCLFIGSIIFYGASGWVPLIFLLGTILWTFIIAHIVVRNRDFPFISLTAISPPLLILFLFKYLGFTTTFFVNIMPNNAFYAFFIQYLLPAGISFYTFQTVSYLIDLRDNKIPVATNFFQFASFISFFPQLIAGPILRYSQIVEQFQHITDTAKITPNYKSGFKFLTVGLFYKTFFADILLALHEAHGSNYGDTTLDALFFVLSYSFIIYFDFWGYSLMAIGIAKLFLIDLPRNFLEPYRSRSPKEFWTRWHVTLSFWLRDYLYLRLRGNEAYTRNIIIVFLATGLWHGAGWNFVVWGCYHGLIVLAYHYTRALWDRLPTSVGVAITFALVTLGWPLFFMDIEGYFKFIQTLVSGKTSNAYLFGLKFWLYLGFVAAWTFLFQEGRWLFSERGCQILENPLCQAILFSSSIIMLDFSRTFIYFQF